MKSVSFLSLPCLCFVFSANAADMPEPRCAEFNSWTAKPASPAVLLYINQTHRGTLLEYTPVTSNTEAVFVLAMQGLDQTLAYSVRLDVQTGGSSGDFLIEMADSSPWNEERGLLFRMAPHDRQKVLFEIFDSSAPQIEISAEGETPSKNWVTVSQASVCPIGPAN